MSKLETIINMIRDEYEHALAIHGGFHSAHEGYALILEEMDELWEVVKMKPAEPERQWKMVQEAIQVAAMAIRLIIDCGGVF